eukprot:COSAG02_NODE_14961_length_1220_cov_0.907226_2_plen_168_part_01
MCLDHAVKVCQLIQPCLLLSCHQGRPVFVSCDMLLIVLKTDRHPIESTRLCGADFQVCLFSIRSTGHPCPGLGNRRLHCGHFHRGPTAAPRRRLDAWSHGFLAPAPVKLPSRLRVSISVLLAQCLARSFTRKLLAQPLRLFFKLYETWLLLTPLLCFPIFPLAIGKLH